MQTTKNGDYAKCADYFIKTKTFLKHLSFLNKIQSVLKEVSQIFSYRNLQCYFFSCGIPKHNQELQILEHLFLFILDLNKNHSPYIGIVWDPSLFVNLNSWLAPIWFLSILATAYGQ